MTPYLEREKSRSISLCVRKSTPLQTPEITPFFVFVIYKNKFTNIFVKYLTFTNTYDTIRTDKTKGDTKHGQPHLLLCKSIKPGTTLG